MFSYIAVALRVKFLICNQVKKAWEKSNADGLAFSHLCHKSFPWLWSHLMEISNQQKKTCVFAGFLGLALIMVVSIYISSRMKGSQEVQLCLKDFRLQKIVEVLNHLKVIKFQVWETTFESLVEVGKSVTRRPKAIVFSGQTSRSVTFTPDSTKKNNYPLMTIDDTRIFTWWRRPSLRARNRFLSKKSNKSNNIQRKNIFRWKVLKWRKYRPVPLKTHDHFLIFMPFPFQKKYFLIWLYFSVFIGFSNSIKYYRTVSILRK